jgi:H2-forming N5,N10-methylenetetrahydromethanopterin dehydrogenase-like enzyme
MSFSRILLVVCALCQLLSEGGVDAFIPSPLKFIESAQFHSLAVKCQQKRMQSRVLGSSSSAGDLDRELDKFFELAAESGFENIKNMTAEERVERVIRGEALEDEIFDLRSELMALEDDMMSGKEGIDIAAVKAMRVKMDKLKAEYKDIVGAKDLPLYFGRLADSMQ